MNAMKTRIAVLVSGGGTNLQALLDAQTQGVLTSGEIVLVVSNKKDAYALERARNHGVPAKFLSRKNGDFEEKLIRILDENGIELIVLAGFLAILSENFTRHFAKRIINIHPSLIPAFCGMGYWGLHVHEEALKRGVKLTGATVHYVNEIPDGGEIIMQKAVEVLPGDTPEVLQRRVMEQAEWKILPASTEQVAKRMMDERMKRMNIYEIPSISSRIAGNSYVGRGIIVGMTEDGKNAACAYFIMGRSANSRNRVFEEVNGEVFTRPFDESKVQDPSLIIYAALRTNGHNLIVTNGNQTDTVYEGLENGKTFAEALESREFEPDAPNYTPRISAMLTMGEKYTYQMSILKSIDAEGTDCARYTFSYPAKPGLGHFIHTYVCDGSPIPTFQGEPERVFVPSDIDAFTNEIWNSLDDANKISLYVRYVNLETGAIENRLVNKNK